MNRFLCNAWDILYKFADNTLLVFIGVLGGYYLGIKDPAIFAGLSPDMAFRVMAYAALGLFVLSFVNWAVLRFVLKAEPA